MKKYIRVNDDWAIYRIHRSKDREYPFLVGRFHFTKEDMDEYQQADTIEELLEAFVAVFKVKGKEFHKYYPISSYDTACLVSEIGQYKPKIYGAIWTGHGLVYAAKYTKGGWKLL